MSNALQGPAGASDLGALSSLAPQLAQTFVTIASDIALVIDSGGVIRNVAVGADPMAGVGADWVGRAWADTVTGDTRVKIEQLLLEAQAGTVTRRREVNHPMPGGHDVPVTYAAVRLGLDGPVLAVGRDLRAVSAIQQRLVEAQRDLERDYWRQRQAETRYRLLFQAATDGVLVVDAHSGTILEANRAAAGLLRLGTGLAAGQLLSAGVAPPARAAVDELLRTTRTIGRPGEVRVAGALGQLAGALDISATPFSADDQLLLLVRVRAADGVGDGTGDDTGARLADFVHRTPDAVVITDANGRVLMANPAFAQLCRDAAGGLAVNPVGHVLAELLGDPAHQLPAILSEARHRGIADQRPASLGHSEAMRMDLEVSAALLAEGDQECLGLTLRRTDQRLALLPPQVGALAAAIDRLAARVGLVTLPELLQETADLAERHLIDNALRRSQGDRMQAAQLLGVTPENLWLRMRHHGLGRAVPDGGAPSGLLN